MNVFSQHQGRKAPWCNFLKTIIIRIQEEMKVRSVNKRKSLKNPEDDDII